VKATNHFTVIAKDQYHNRRLVGGDDLKVTLVADGLPDVDGTVQDNKDGSYLIAYFLHDKAEYTLAILINGTAVGSSSAPFKIDANYANNPVPTLIIVAAVLGACIVLAVIGYFVYRKMNRVKYDLLE